MRSALALELADAERLLAAAQAEARRDGSPVAAAVVDGGGRLLAFRRLDGASPAAAEAAIGLAILVIYFRNRGSIEVEDAVFSHPEVAEVAVIGVPDPKWGETVKALVVTTPGSTLTEADLIAYCKSRLAGYKCPTSIEFRSELARTATGKLQKFILRAPYWEGLERQVN